MESAIVCVDKRRKKTKLSRLEWFANDQFQLQRMAHEELGMGTWTGCAGVRAIPVTTEKGQVLAMLDCTDPEHPILKREGDITVHVNSNSDTVLAGKMNNESVINAHSLTPTSHTTTTVNSDFENDATTTGVENNAVAMPASSPVSTASVFHIGDVATVVAAQHGNEVDDSDSLIESISLTGSPIPNRPDGDNVSSSPAYGSVGEAPQSAKARWTPA